MHPIALVHGCTVGEMAQMINGENWLKTDKKCDLTIILVENYTHSMAYSLPVPPSPNLPNDLSVRLYPSLCFFEAKMCIRDSCDAICVQYQAISIFEDGFV